MTDELTCPYCSSPRLKILQGIYKEFVRRDLESGEVVEERIHYYRCLECGREFEGDL